MHEFQTRRRIEFSDTDMGGIVHFSRYFIFMETAEDQFLRAHGAAFTFQEDGRRGGWPKVAASCEYLGPARYGDELEIRIQVRKITRSTITYGFEIRRGADVLARAQSTSVCVTKDSAGGMASRPIPADLAARISVAPGSSPATPA
jgi:YbgC/YbaW family acyl-CoA thioester hydrolase